MLRKTGYLVAIGVTALAVLIGVQGQGASAQTPTATPTATASATATPTSTATATATAANVADFMPRESDAQVQKDFYAAYIAENFADLQAAARPYDDLRAEPGAATPAA